jgi:hypothetical protein
MKNYPDVFAVSDKQLIKKVDGSFALFSSEEVQQLSRQGKIQIEYPKSKGGWMEDYIWYHTVSVSSIKSNAI